MRSENLDGKLLRIMVDDIATPIFHIFNLSLLERVRPLAWRGEKSFHYQRIVKPLYWLKELMNHPVTNP
jgi:hypothetical protein